MKKLTFFVLFYFLSVSLCYAGQTWVNGYYRSNGTYVQGHWKTTPDSLRTNNFSYPGNFNPNTGKINPYSTSPAKTYPVNPNPYKTYSPSPSGSTQPFGTFPKWQKWKSWDE